MRQIRETVGMEALSSTAVATASVSLKTQLESRVFLNVLWHDDRSDKIAVPP